MDTAQAWQALEEGGELVHTAVALIRVNVTKLPPPLPVVGLTVT